ncbi:hypothetical protein [Acinetobacter phage XC1]|nr:hypothetical protein [Acinetobacter phage XC1]
MFYKIECKETLAKIDDFMEKRNELYNQVKLICEKYGFELHQTHDSIQFGIKFYNMVANPNSEIDKKLWKTRKQKNGYLCLLPRATAKEHKKEYEALIPKQVDYTELTKLLIKDELPWNKSYGYRYKKGGYFMFETSLPVADTAIEILGSEYNRKEDND